MGGYQAASLAWITGSPIYSTGPLDGMFSSPSGIVADPTGTYLYVADGNRIVKMNASTGAFLGAIGNVTTAGGTCSTTGLTSGWCSGGVFSGSTSVGGFSNVRNIAIDSTGTFLYVTDSSNFRIVKVDISTGISVGAIGKVTTTGGTCTTLGATTGWCTGGIFGTGTGAGMYAMPQSVILDSAGSYLYIVDTNNNSVIKVNAGSGAFIGAIGKVTTTGGTCTTLGAASGWCSGGIFGTGTADGMFTFPIGLAIDSTGSSVFIGAGGGRIVKINASTGAVDGVIGNVLSTGGTCTSTGVTSGWCKGGTFQIGTGDGMYDTPQAIKVDASGIMYVAEGAKATRINAATGAVIGSIGNVTTTGGTCATIGATSGWCLGGTYSNGTGDGMLNYPKSIEVDSSGYLYMGDASYRVMKYNASTGAFLGSTGRATRPNNSWAFSLTATGITPGGTNVAGILASPQVVISHPTQAYLYIIDNGGMRLSKVNRTTGGWIGSIGYINTPTQGTCTNSFSMTPTWCSGSTFVNTNTAGDSFQNIKGLAIDPTGAYLFVSDSAQIHRFDADTGAGAGAIGYIGTAGGGLYSYGSCIWLVHGCWAFYGKYGLWWIF